MLFSLCTLHITKKKNSGSQIYKVVPCIHCCWIVELEGEYPLDCIRHPTEKAPAPALIEATVGHLVALCHLSPSGNSLRWQQLHATTFIRSRNYIWQHYVSFSKHLPCRGQAPFALYHGLLQKEYFGKVEDLSCFVWLEAVQHCLGAVFMQKQKSSLMNNNWEVWGKGRERDQLNSFSYAKFMWSVNQLINLSVGNAPAYTDQNVPAGSAFETLQLSRELQTVNLKNIKKQSTK